MERARPRAGAATALALLAAEVLAVGVLVRLGRTPGFAVPVHDVGGWLRTPSTETVVAGTARLLALGLAIWLLVATVLSLARRLLPLGRAAPALDLVTPRSLRRLLDRLVVAGLGASLAIGAARPAAASTASTRLGVARAGVDTPVPRVPPAAGPPAPVTTAAPVPVTTPVHAAPPARAAPAGSVVVAPGDNLWVIAARAVGSERASEIAPYWRALIRVNVATLRSHDPNLIFPGEHLVLPSRPARSG
jgi:hypothetical protein